MEITSKEELLSLTTDLVDKEEEVSTQIESLVSSLSGVECYELIDVATPAKTLKNNLEIAEADVATSLGNIANYSNEVSLFDVDDFEGGNVEEYLSGVNGSTVVLPAGLGSVHTYMGWQCITAVNSNQYRLREAAGMNFDKEGFARIGERYVVATTTTYGQVGDYIDVVQEDGTVIKCIIGDIKNQNDPGCNQWGHNDGHCVVEFVVDQGSWYGTNKTPNGYHPEWNQNITSITNKGNYFNLASAAMNNSSAQASNGNWNSAALYASGVTTGAVTGQSTSSVNGATNLNLVPNQNTSGNPNIDISKYNNNPSCGFQVTAGNASYNISAEDYDLLCAIVAAESDNSYDDALAVITTILNRCEDPAYVRQLGNNPVSQATARDQFVVYQTGIYKRFTGGNCSDKVKIAVMDALNGVRNHDYLSFRSNDTYSYSNNMISARGNRYL